MCVAVLAWPRRNPALAAEVRFLPGRGAQVVVGLVGTIILTTFLVIHISKDLRADMSAWYFHSTWLWLIVMALASLVFFREWSTLKRSGADVERIFSTLPPE